MKRESGVYCERVLQDDVAVAYLRGELPEAERDAFEEHYFACADCFERLQTSDPDAKVTKMKDGRTHLAQKAEHAVDLDSGALIAVTIQGADEGDTATIAETLAEAEAQLDAVNEQAPEEVDADGPAEVVADKGYHCDATLLEIESRGLRSYISEPDRGRRKWKDDLDAQLAVYANRRRIRGDHEKRQACGASASSAPSHTCTTPAQCVARTYAVTRTFSNVRSSTPADSIWVYCCGTRSGRARRGACMASFVSCPCSRVGSGMLPLAARSCGLSGPPLPGYVPSCVLTNRWPRETAFHHGLLTEAADQVAQPRDAE